MATYSCGDDDDVDGGGDDDVDGGDEEEEQVICRSYVFIEDLEEPRNSILSIIVMIYPNSNISHQTFLCLQSTPTKPRSHSPYFSPLVSLTLPRPFLVRANEIILILKTCYCIVEKWTKQAEA